ncbi:MULTISPECIES: SDR family oxidoreductase [Microbacterium]|jgi:gluconate 5-dehydrogenase|uniref:SDR family oxidoreductase n=1 Tax=Microbacterium TaxID=33882 RepID=UPI0023D9BA65|nr:MULTISPECIES: SDR family oxidoreductase [Microbacterium]MDF2046387.1 SDR family oxidoreductase [Microbacterium sp. Kw_RZR3]MDF2918255.1 dehydrogenase with different specificity [Microbacterium sp.]MDQ1076446.1 gluconate 5-dehydrogenase [Microbacterium sp. SORGH_AS_0969]MDQ1116683.1 gluconate 5-dehydrogenase [Microbacterium testaceum]
MTASNADLFDVSDRLALVTGSSRGLGRGLALTLARGGARLIVHGRDADAVEQTRAEAEELSGRPAHAVTFDVSDAGAVESAVADLLDNVGAPDILVNNAGVQRRAPIHEFPVADWDDIVAANLSGVFYVSRFITPAMVARGSGKVVNVASVQSRLARQTIAPYSATKGGVAQLTAGMAADLARFGIQVNALSPGYFATEMNRALVDDPEFTRWLTQRTPAARWGDVDELRGALLFLASDASSFVSGQNIFVDGGMTAVV